jgi:hypothetical protein
MGFSDRKGTTIWRRTNVKFDILKFDLIPPSFCEKWSLPYGSFVLDPSCLFPFLPRVGFYPIKGSVGPEKGFGQVRLSVNRGINQPEVKSPNAWWPGEDNNTLEYVVHDVRRAIEKHSLPFFSRFDSPEELLQILLEDDHPRSEGRNAKDTSHVWGIGLKGSPSRLLYTGFSAIECRRWDLAFSSLEACKEKTMAIQRRWSGSTLQEDLLPIINEGLSCIEHKRAWSMSF